MNITATALPEVMLIEPAVYRDERGWFYESFREERFAAAGLPSRFPQDNQSRSTKGVLRGLHYQLSRPQGKLVSCTHGEIFDVAVDIRRGSPRFGKWVGVRMSGDEPRQLWIPPGFAHGFCALSDVAVVTYKCSDVFDASSERGVLWCDQDIGIAWPIENPIVSGRDRQHPRLRDMTNDLPPYGAGA